MVRNTEHYLVRLVFAPRRVQGATLNVGVLHGRRSADDTLVPVGIGGMRTPIHGAERGAGYRLRHASSRALSQHSVWQRLACPKEIPWFIRSTMTYCSSRTGFVQMQQSKIG